MNRTVPVKHLDAHILPVEEALLARAAHLERQYGTDLALLLAAEFRKLAEELHLH